MEENFVKVISATYRLLDFFPDNEPLKYKAKEKVLAVLEGLTLVSDSSGWISLKNYLSADRQKIAAKLLDDIDILKKYLQLGKHQGWVGGINFLILLKKYDEIKNQIKPLRENINQNLLAKNEIKLIAEKIKKDNNTDKIKMFSKVIFSPETTESQGKLSERQEKIINVISVRGKAQVSDIIKEIPNTTKRTIRRDLGDLLKKSKLVRNGEWNKVFYQLG